MRGRGGAGSRDPEKVNKCLPPTNTPCRRGRWGLRPCARSAGCKDRMQAYPNQILKHNSGPSAGPQSSIGPIFDWINLRLDQSSSIIDNNRINLISFDLLWYIRNPNCVYVIFANEKAQLFTTWADLVLFLVAKHKQCNHGISLNNFRIEPPDNCFAIACSQGIKYLQQRCSLKIDPHLQILWTRLSLHSCEEWCRFGIVFFPLQSCLHTAKKY